MIIFSPISGSPLASRIIQDTIKEKLIKPYGNEPVAGKSAIYLPYWV